MVGDQMPVEVFGAFLPLAVALVLALGVIFGVLRRRRSLLARKERVGLTLWLVFMIAVGVAASMGQSIAGILRYAITATIFTAPWFVLSELGRRALFHSSPKRPDESDDKGSR
jgi:hypothetical protein